MNQYGSSFGSAPVHSMPTGPTDVQLSRQDRNTPWGFRIQGGQDFRQQLSIKKVTKGAPADGHVHAGDAILSISGYNTNELTHAQAKQMIQQSGNTVQFTLQKGQFRSIKPSGPVKFSPGTAFNKGY